MPEVLVTSCELVAAQISLGHGQGQGAQGATVSRLRDEGAQRQVLSRVSSLCCSPSLAAGSVWRDLDGQRGQTDFFLPSHVIKI